MKCWWEWISFRICDLGKRQMTNGKDYADNAVLPQAQISWSIISNQPKKLVCIFRMISSVQPSRKGLVYRIGGVCSRLQANTNTLSSARVCFIMGKCKQQESKNHHLITMTTWEKFKTALAQKNWFIPYASPPKCGTHHWNRLHTKPTTLWHNILVCKTRFLLIILSNRWPVTAKCR